MHVAAAFLRKNELEALCKSLVLIDGRYAGYAGCISPEEDPLQRLLFPLLHGLFQKLIKMEIACPAERRQTSAALGVPHLLQYNDGVDKV